MSESKTVCTIAGALFDFFTDGGYGYAEMPETGGIVGASTREQVTAALTATPQSHWIEWAKALHVPPPTKTEVDQILLSLDTLLTSMWGDLPVITIVPKGTT